MLKQHLLSSSHSFLDGVTDIVSYQTLHVCNAHVESKHDQTPVQIAPVTHLVCISSMCILPDLPGSLPAR